ncbi:MAG: cytochrome c3 family protein [bacterium]|nr:cytochrome c3 family protein [bacterium]
MNKNIKIFYILILAFIFAPSIAFSYFMVIDPIQNRVPVVYFNHTKHLDKQNGLGFACEKCHHELKTPEQKPTNCPSCHNVGHDESQLEEKNLPPRLKVAYHNMCRGCHTENKRKYKGAPTSECGGCHIKELENFIQEKNKKNKDQEK